MTLEHFEGCPEDYPCYNGGQCINRECVCNRGFSGMMCETNNAEVAVTLVVVHICMMSRDCQSMLTASSL